MIVPGSQRRCSVHVEQVLLLLLQYLQLLQLEQLLLVLLVLLGEHVLHLHLAGSARHSHGDGRAARQARDGLTPRHHWLRLDGDRGGRAAGPGGLARHRDGRSDRPAAGLNGR